MNKKYIKKDIIKRASYKLHMSHNDCKIITDCFFEILEQMITENKDSINIEVRNFGVFNVLKTKDSNDNMKPNIFSIGRLYQSTKETDITDCLSYKNIDVNQIRKLILLIMIKFLSY